VENSFGPVVLNLSTGVVSGMAKFLNTGDVLDFNTSPNSSNVSVDIATGEFPGHVWSVSNGYINFEDPGVSVTLGAKLINVPGNILATTANDSRGIALRRLPPFKVAMRKPNSLPASFKKRFMILLAFPLSRLMSTPEWPPFNPVRESFKASEPAGTSSFLNLKIFIFRLNLTEQKISFMAGSS
jgi:hypothetical protein